MNIIITGTLGSGKSSFANLLFDLISKGKEHIEVNLINADDLGRGLLSNQDIIKKIKSTFPEVKSPIESSRLGEIVFSSKSNLNKLNAIMHPPLIKKIRSSLILNNSTINIVDAALFNELNLASLADFTVLIKANLDLVSKRLKNPNHLSRINYQSEPSFPDFMVINNHDFVYLESEAKRIWNQIKK